MSEKNLTLVQTELKNEFVAIYGISEDQISFEGEKTEPIFDFEALSVLREKLTNFKSVDVSQVTFNAEDKSAEAVCVIFTTNDRTITVSDFAEIGELMPDGNQLFTSLQAKRVARARAMRSGIRAAGVNLLKAHRIYLETGSIPDFQPVDPRLNSYKEIHVLAGEIGFINGSDKSEYKEYLGEMFDGRTSSKDLDDLELRRLIVSLRAMRRVQVSTIAAQDLRAA